MFLVYLHLEERTKFVYVRQQQRKLAIADKTINSNTQFLEYFYAIHVF